MPCEVGFNKILPSFCCNSNGFPKNKTNYWPENIRIVFCSLSISLLKFLCVFLRKKTKGHMGISAAS